jgi:hypothetical protein
MKVLVNFEKGEHGNTIKEGTRMRIASYGENLVDSQSVILADYKKVGNVWHGYPILIPIHETPLVQSILLKRQGMTLAGKKYLLKTVGHDAKGQRFTVIDEFEIRS